MKLTKGKISKLYKKNRQSHKRKKHKKNKSSRNKTFRKRKALNLARRTLRRLKQTGGVNQESLQTSSSLQPSLTDKLQPTDETASSSSLEASSTSDLQPADETALSSLLEPSSTSELPPSSSLDASSTTDLSSTDDSLTGNLQSIDETASSLQPSLTGELQPIDEASSSLKADDLSSPLIDESNKQTAMPAIKEAIAVPVDDLNPNNLQMADVFKPYNSDKPPALASEYVEPVIEEPKEEQPKEEQPKEVDPEMAKKIEIADKATELINLVSGNNSYKTQDGFESLKNQSSFMMGDAPQETAAQPIIVDEKSQSKVGGKKQRKTRGFKLTRKGKTRKSKR